jgi:hypothetical protein
MNPDEEAKTAHDPQAPSMVQTFVCYMEKLVAETRQQEESKAQGFSQATLRDMRTRRPF